MKKSSIGLCVAALGFVNFGCAKVIVQPKIDHFKVWEVKEEPVQREVMLKGQFDRQGQPTKVGVLAAFANPVRKNRYRIRDDNAHLTWYRIDRREPARTVRFMNQFGTRKWKLSDAKWLLLPAEKKEPDLVFPEKLDHFVCYDAGPRRPVLGSVKLEDQFDRTRKQVEKVKLEPAYFCVPAAKDRGTITNERDHLAIYRIKPVTHLEPPLGVPVRDQFGEHKLTVLRSVFLAVPSWKLSYREKGN